MTSQNINDVKNIENVTKTLITSQSIDDVIHLNVVGDHADVGKSFDSHSEIVFTLANAMLLVDDTDAKAKVKKEKNEANDDDDHNGDSGFDVETVGGDLFGWYSNSARWRRCRYFNQNFVRDVVLVWRGSCKSGRCRFRKFRETCFRFLGFGFLFLWNVESDKVRYEIVP